MILNTKSNNAMCVGCVHIMHLCFLMSINSIHVNGEQGGSFGHKSCLNTSVNTLCHSTQQWPKRINDKFIVTMEEKKIFRIGNKHRIILFILCSWMTTMRAVCFVSFLSFFFQIVLHLQIQVAILTQDRGWQVKFNL